jgi:plastocyanin
MPGIPDAVPEKPTDFPVDRSRQVRDRSHPIEIITDRVHIVPGMRTEIIPGLLVCIILACSFAAGCSGTTGGTGTITHTTATPAATTAIATIPSGSVTINLVASGIAFDQSRITVPAGSQVTINFDNRDAGIPHNFALYADVSATAPLFKGEIITGPKMTTYYFTAPTRPGTYYFQCDVHPSLMNGQFIVT